MNPIIAVLASDIHLSHKPPVARSAEKSWYLAMRRQLEEVGKLCLESHCPIVIAGDVFDGGWRPSQCPPELISFAMKYLPQPCYAVPGQHDLPHHRLEDIRKSALWTLSQAQKITLLEPNKPVDVVGYTPLRLHGFPWGVKVKPLKNPQDLAIEIAVIHSYIWTSKTGYVGADEEKRLSAYRDKLNGYDVAVFGDNHNPITHTLDTASGTCLVFNSGGFYRRRSDERDYQPSVGLLHADGVVKRHYLDVSADVFSEVKDVTPMFQGSGVEEIIKELNELGDQGLDFSAAVRRAANDDNVPEGVRRSMLSALEDK